MAENARGDNPIRPEDDTIIRTLGLKRNPNPFLPPAPDKNLGTDPWSLGTHRTFELLARDVRERGWSIYPQARTGTRKPGVEVPGRSKMVRIQGLRDALPDAEDVAQWARANPTLNVACVFGPAQAHTFALDVDVDEIGLSARVQMLARDVLGDTPFARVGRHPRVALIYRTDGSWTPANATHRLADAGGGDSGHAVEILSAGKSLTLLGIHHAEGTGFTWHRSRDGVRGNPVDTPPTAAPVVTEEAFEAFLSRLEEIGHGLVAPARARIRSTEAFDAVEGTGGLREPVLVTLPDGCIERDGVVVDGREKLVFALAGYASRLNPAAAQAGDDRLVGMVCRLAAARMEVSGRWAGHGLESDVRDKVGRTGRAIAEGRLVAIPDPNGPDGDAAEARVWERTVAAAVARAEAGDVDGAAAAVEGVVAAATGGTVDADAARARVREASEASGASPVAVSTAMRAAAAAPVPTSRKRADAARARVGRATKRVDEDDGPTQIELARSFVDGCHERHAFETGTREWLAWTGTHWERDGGMEASRALTRHLVTESEAAETPAARRRMQSRGSHEAVMAFAREDARVAVKEADFDACPWTLATPGGLVDLRDGTIRPATPADRVSRCTAVPPADVATPVWDALLDHVCGGDPDLVDYMWRWTGYCLTGSVREQVLTLFKGPGGRGKGTILNALRRMFGSYGITCDTAILLKGGARNAGGPRQDQMDLRGPRMIVMSEASGCDRFDEAGLKRLTGDDPIRARGNYQTETSEFAITAKFCVGLNVVPALSSVDAAKRRRIRIFPFDVDVPVADKGLKDKIEAELPGILHRAIRGAMDWYRAGLPMPVSMQAATYAWLDTQDVVAEFVAEVFEVTGDEADRVPVADVWKAYETWARERGCPRDGPVDGKALTVRLADKGIPSRPTKIAGRTVKAYRGVRMGTTKLRAVA